MHIRVSLRRRLHINGKLLEQYLYESLPIITMWAERLLQCIQSSRTMYMFEWFGSKSNCKDWLCSIAIFAMHKQSQLPRWINMYSR